MIKTQFKRPKSRRMCPVCEKITKFAFNVNIGHSECIECGFRYIKLSGVDE